jgi:hypothetical protein
MPYVVSTDPVRCDYGSDKYDDKSSSLWGTVLDKRQTFAACY